MPAKKDIKSIEKEVIEVISKKEVTEVKEIKGAIPQKPIGYSTKQGN